MKHNRILHVVLAILLCASTALAFTTYSLVDHAVDSSFGANTTTTTAINSTGSDILFAACSDYAAVTRAVVTDSKSNSWTALTSYSTSAAVRTTIWYAKNPSVGSGHTATCAGTGTFPGLAFAAFSGSDLTAPFDKENGAHDDNNNTLGPGIITPAADNSLVLTAFGWSTTGAPSAPPTGYTLLDQADKGVNNFGVAFASQIQTTATATNPVWSKAGLDAVAASVAAFKVSSGAAARRRFVPQGGNP